MAKIDAFFKLMNDEGASDLHLAAGKQPLLRVRGELERVEYDVLSDDDLKAMLYEIAPEHRFQTAISAKGGGRVKTILYKVCEGLDASGNCI